LVALSRRGELLRNGHDLRILCCVVVVSVRCIDFLYRSSVVNFVFEDLRQSRALPPKVPYLAFGKSKSASASTSTTVPDRDEHVLPPSSKQEYPYSHTARGLPSQCIGTASKESRWVSLVVGQHVAIPERKS